MSHTLSKIQEYIESMKLKQSHEKVTIWRQERSDEQETQTGSQAVLEADMSCGELGYHSGRGTRDLTLEAGKVNIL